MIKGHAMTCVGILPKTVTFTNGSTINYYYAADGTKLREVRTESGTATPAKRYFVRDHLGSIRAVVDDAGTTLETDDYYPLGGPLPTGTATALQPEKYQGKEWNATESFNIYDFGARLYDSGLGRWISQDPMAEEYFLHSPYLFCAGNPMRFVDPEGRTIFFRVFHDNNTFTEYEWREMDGEWGFYDSDNEIYAGSNEYFLSLSKAMSFLMEGRNGSEMVREVAERSERIQISDNRSIKKVNRSNRFIYK